VGAGFQAPWIKHVARHRLEWAAALDGGGAALGVLRDNRVEVRTAADTFAAVKVHCVVARDPAPRWRHIAWSPDARLLAVVSGGSIHIVDRQGRVWHTLPVPHTGPSATHVVGDEAPDIHSTVNAIAFVDPKIRSPNWAAELLVLDAHGGITAYLIEYGCASRHFASDHRIFLLGYRSALQWNGMAWQHAPILILILTAIQARARMCWLTAALWSTTTATSRQWSTTRRALRL
jgi:hypothetical protein